MNTKKFSEAMGEIDSKYIDRAINYQPIKRVKKNNMKKLTIRIMAVCASFVLVFFAVINIWMPVQARTIPFLGSAFAVVQDKLDFAGLYSNYAFEIGDTAVDNGITVTLSEIYCDGTNLYVGFAVESEKSFSEISPDDYGIGQLYYEGTAYISGEDGRMKLSEYGVAALEGQFYDEYTFVGIETFSLDDSNFPSEFAFEMKINSIGIKSDGMNVKTTNGKWKFSALAKSNTDDVVTYEINKEMNGHTIDRVVVTPVMITVYTSYPDLYSGTTRYMVNVFSDLSPDENITKQGRYGATVGIDQIPRNRVDNVLYIYVIDRDQLCKTGKEMGAREEIEEHAIVWAEIVID